MNQRRFLSHAAVSSSVSCCRSDRLRQAILVVFLLVALTTVTRASPLVDPYLERFLVGHQREPDLILVQEKGWPTELFTPLELDQDWIDAFRHLFADSLPAQDARLITWRFLGPASKSREHQIRWSQQQLQRLDTLELAWAGGYPAVTPAADPLFLLKEICYVIAFKHYEEERYKKAYTMVRAILTASERLQLSDAEAFVWSLRSRELQELTREGDEPTVASPGSGSVVAEPAWPELYRLGAYDAQSGWATWVARQRYLGRPLIPAGKGDDRLARFLLQLRQWWLTAEDIESAGFAEPAAAALGAVVLPQGESLAEHLAHHGDPPREDHYLEPWLRGQRRQAGFAPARTEELARLAGLPLDYQVDLWRRASEAWLLRGEWGHSLADLEQGLIFAKRLVKGGKRDRLYDWTGQVLALAVAQERAAELADLTELIALHVPTEANEILREEVRYWQARQAGSGGESGRNTANRLESARQLVIRGLAAAVGDSTAANLQHTSQEYHDALWRIWARWGLALVKTACPAGDCLTPRQAEYRAALQSVLAAGSGSARLASACAASARWLRQDPHRDGALLWALHADLRRLSAGQVVTFASPMVDLATSGVGTNLVARLTRHALLGLCLALGDGRGQLALATALPRESLSHEERLLMLYPLPAASDLLTTVAGCGVDAALVFSVIRNESLFDPAARSAAGALGWMQIMPFHYPGRGFSDGKALWRQDHVSLTAGVGLLRENSRRYQADPYRSLAAYNAGGGAVDRWDRQLGPRQDGTRQDRDIFLAWIGYPETRRYTEKVLIGREIYDWILQEEWTDPARGIQATEISGSSR